MNILDPKLVVAQIKEMGDGGKDRLDLFTNLRKVTQLVNGLSAGLLITYNNAPIENFVEDELRELFVVHKKLILEFSQVGLKIQKSLIEKTEKALMAGFAV